MIETIFIIVVLGLIVTYHVALLGFVVGLFYAALHLHLISWIVAHPLVALFRFSVYFLAGAVFSVVKWYLFVRERAEAHKFDPAYRNFYVAREEKGTITAWITFWPIVAVWTIIEEYVLEIANKIWKQLLKTYDRMTELAWRKP